MYCLNIVCPLVSVHFTFRYSCPLVNLFNSLSEALLSSSKSLTRSPSFVVPFAVEQSVRVEQQKKELYIHFVPHNFVYYKDIFRRHTFRCCLHKQTNIPLDIPIFYTKKIKKIKGKCVYINRYMRMYTPWKNLKQSHRQGKVNNENKI